MLKIGQLLYTLKADQTLSSKVSERLQKYLAEEGKIFSRYSSLENHISAELNALSEQVGDDSLQFRLFINLLDSLLNDPLETGVAESPTCSEVVSFCQTYINEMSKADRADNLQHISKSLNKVKSIFSQESVCSFATAARLLKKKSLSVESMKLVLRNIYFACDYLNIPSIITIRSYIIAHPSKFYIVPQPLWKKIQEIL